MSDGTGTTRVAFLGLGIMGSRMSPNLLRAGFEVTLWNRTRERAEAVAAEHGGRVADTPAEAAAAAEVTITMVVDAPQVEEVLFGPDGAVQGMHEGHLAVDMSTIAPTAAREIAGRLEAHGVDMLDAPVSGSKPKAEDGTLTIMAGGAEAAFRRARPLLEAMGDLVVHVGPLGHGQMVKLINNTLAAIHAAALGEAIALARRADLDLGALVRVTEAGSGASAMLALKNGPMRDHDFDPLFRLAHMLKDVRHCLEEAEALGVPLRLASEAERMYAEAADRGRGEEDFAAVVEVAEAAAGLIER